jgi:hypothetical protein
MAQRLLIKFDQTLKAFVELLGNENVQAKVNDVRSKADSLEKGFPLTYQTYFYPRNLLWLALHRCIDIWSQGKTIAAEIEKTNDDTLVFPVLMALPIVQLFGTLPEWRKQQVVANILSSDEITSLYHEFDLGWDCLGKGYSLNWHDERGTDGRKVPEFRATRDVSFDAEVKAIGQDTGSPIKQLHASLLGESLIRVTQNDTNLMGCLSLRFADAVPVAENERQAVTEKIRPHLKAGDVQFDSGGISVRGRLSLCDDVPTTMERVRQDHKLGGAQDYSPYMLVAAKRADGGKISNPIICQFFSEREDTLEKAVKRVLRDCIKKFDGMVPGIVRLYMPYVSESFAGHVSDQFTRDLMDWFIANEERRAKIAAVQFVGDYDMRHFATNVEVFCPKRSFVNPAFAGFPGLEVLMA